MNKSLDVWIYALQHDFCDAREWHYTITNHGEMESEGWVLVDKQAVEFKVPDEKYLTAKTVEAMREALKKLKADNYVKEQRMEDRINSLLAIEHKVDPLAWSKAAGVEEF